MSITNVFSQLYAMTELGVPQYTIPTKINTGKSVACIVHSSYAIDQVFCQIEEVFGYTGTQPWIATTSYANGKMLSEHPSVLLTIHIPMQIFIPVQLVVLAADGKTGIDLGTL